MTIESHKVKTTDCLFFLAFGIFLTFGILTKSFYYQYFVDFYSIIKMACIVLLFVREFTIERYSVRSLVIAVIFIVLIILCRLESSLSSVMYILAFLYCARNINIISIARFAAWITLFALIFIVGSSFLGIIENHEFYQNDRLRYGLGFRYMLYGPSLMFNLTALFIYIKKENIKWIGLLILAIANIWFFTMTQARLTFGLSVCIILVSAFLKVRPIFFAKKRILCYIMIVSFIICMLVSLLFTLIYDSDVPWLKELNTVLEGRLEYGKSSLNEYGVTLFGQNIEFIGNGLDVNGQVIEGTYNYVDSLYIKVLQSYGIVFFVLWIGLLTYTLYRCYKVKDHWMMICLSFVAFQCILDDQAWEFYMNTFWFATVIVLDDSWIWKHKMFAMHKIMGEEISESEPELPEDYNALQQPDK